METKIVQALRQALIDEMRRDPAVVLLGQDIAVFGGADRVPEGLLELFGEERVRDTPISEAAMIGAAVGAAMTGLKPVVEIQFNDFIACGMDQLCNQAAKIRFMMGGQVSVPLVLRAPYGATGRAAQHSQSLEAWFMHTPGIMVVIPSTPYDAKGLLKSAIRDDNPGSAYRAAPDEEYRVPLGQADLKRSGRDATVVATGLMVHKALAAAAVLAREGVSVEVLDPRTLVPLDREAILASAAKTGRVVVASEDTATCGFGAEVAALLAERALDRLLAPVKRVCVPDTPIPFAPALERAVIPQEQDIAAAVRQLLEGSS